MRAFLMGRDIVVIGASAGGVETLSRLFAGLRPDLPAAFFVVMHMPAHGHSVLPELLARAGRLPARNPEDREPIKHGQIYVAPPDYHLLLEPDRVRLSHGPKENRSRPAVDPLFRTAAKNFGERVIGIVLSGALDDGSMGLKEIKNSGGLAIVQDPAEAFHSDMPRNAREVANPDYCLPVAKISSSLLGFIR